MGVNVQKGDFIQPVNSFFSLTVEFSFFSSGNTMVKNGLVLPVTIKNLLCGGKK